MKNYNKSDYVINKANATAIVYSFVDGTHFNYTLEMYLSENPNKTYEDFMMLKNESDSDLYKQNRCDYRSGYRNVPIHGLEETNVVATPSLENIVFDLPKHELEKSHRKQLAIQILDSLTEIQRRRYILHKVNGLTVRNIAIKEGVKHQSVVENITSAENKIKKVLRKLSKTPCQNA